MFIPEFWAGVFATVGFEIVALIVAGIIVAVKKK